MKFCEEARLYLALVLVLLSGSCGDRQGSDSSRAYDPEKARAIDARWSEGAPNTNGINQEIHATLFTNGLYVHPSYRVSGKNWIGTLGDARKMEPSPILIVKVEKNVTHDVKNIQLSKIADVYGCAPYKCFFY